MGCARVAHSDEYDDGPQTSAFAIVCGRSWVTLLCYDEKETTGANYPFGIEMHPASVAEPLYVPRTLDFREQKTKERERHRPDESEVPLC